MRIGVDATSWANRRGYGRFARNAVSRLVALDPSSTYVLYIDEASADTVELPPGTEQRRVACRRPPSQAAAESSRPVGDLLRLRGATSSDSLDVFLFPSVYTYFPVTGVPTVVGVHDVIADELPELTLPSRRGRVLWRLKETLAVRSATELFTVSAVSRSAVATRFGIPVSRLAIVPEAPDPVFHPRDEDSLRRELSPLRLAPGRFLLYSGGISPHKNIETLLDAYAELSAERPSTPPLVVVGDLDDDSYLSAAASVRARIAELEISERVVLPGFVSDEALACLYGAATAVVVPSLAEGFGLPAVEAAACGAAVVLSDLPAHRETLDGAALFFKPTDGLGLRDALERVVGDERLRHDLQRRAADAVERLSWDATAAALRELLAAAGRRGRARRINGSRVGS